MDLGKPRKVVAAAGQIQSRLMNEAAATLDSIGGLIAEAGRQRVELLVLPECAYPAYLLGSVASYRAGEHLSSEAFLAWLGEQAVRFGLHIVCGHVEDAGAALCNAAALIGPDGRVVGRARKRFLWHVDHDWFAPGDEIAAFDTALGRIGIIICAEARVPEIIATLAADGAELIAMPTCWINAARQPGEYYNPQPEFLNEARAQEFGLPFICADKSGLELTTGYVGQSCIVDGDGTTVALAPAEGEALIVAPVLPRQARPTCVAEGCQARLLSSAPAMLPGRTAPRELTLAAGCTTLLASRLEAETGDALLKRLKSEGVDLLFAKTPRDTSTAEKLSMSAKEFSITAIGCPARTEVSGAASAKVGCMAGEWLRSFATGRALALSGVEVLVYFDAEDLPMLRARALENRVFVIGVGQQTSAIVGPDGVVLAQGTAENAAIARVNLAAASNKLVAPRTDIFAQRRPEMYRL